MKNLLDLTGKESAGDRRQPGHRQPAGPGAPRRGRGGGDLLQPHLRRTGWRRRCRAMAPQSHACPVRRGGPQPLWSAGVQAAAETVWAAGSTSSSTPRASTAATGWRTSPPRTGTRVMNINVNGAVYCTQLVGKYMLAQRYGRRSSTWRP